MNTQQIEENKLWPIRYHYLCPMHVLMNIQQIVANETKEIVQKEEQQAVVKYPY